MSNDPGLPVTLRELEAQLRAALAAGLPGAQAQIRMAPRPRHGWRNGERAPEPRDAAALLLLYPKDGHLSVVLTVRGLLAHHSGQVSLPGGVIEAGETVPAAAIREAVEEVGIDAATVRVLGALTPLHIPVSGFTLHPVVAVAESRPDFRGAADEVARILEVPLHVLADGSRLRRHRRRRDDGVDAEIPYFDFDGEQVWGATAMVLAEFLWVLGAAVDPWPATGDEH
jgi:8-oxo-dGTP pyrophosphatase MutT (NUDIX family)